MFTDRELAELRRFDAEIDADDTPITDEERLASDKLQERALEEANRKSRAAKYREYYLKNREEILERYHRKIAEETPEQREARIAKRREYYLNNKTKLDDYQSMYDKAHKEHRREYRKRKYQQNREEIMAYTKKWRHEHPEKVKEYNQRHNAKRKMEAINAK